MQKGKPKMPIKKRIVAAAMAVFVGATSFNVSIPGFSSVVLTDADETEGIREEEESTQAANEVQAQLSNDEMPVVEETESLKQPETVAQTTLEETTTAESTVQPEPTEEAALEETSLAEEEQQPQTSTEEIEQSSEVAKEQQEQTSQEEEQTANDEIALFANEDDSNDAPAVNPIPSLEDYITSAKISEKHGDSWDSVTEITSGTNVRVDLDYSIPAGVITKDTRKMQYQLPTGIKIQKEETGTLKDQNDQPIGTFTIDKNGLVMFDFYDTFSDDKPFTGDFYFECQVDSNKSQEDVKFVFPGTGKTEFTIKPSDDAFDIKAQKTASTLLQGDDGEWYANYTITVSSQRGTSGDVTIIDQLQNNSSSAPYRQTIDMSSIVVKDKAGNVVDPSSFTITPSKDNLGFTTTLPKLKAGESYTITCKALVNKNLLGTNSKNDIYLNANKITAKSGNNSSSAQTSVKYKRNAIEKTVTKQDDGSYFYTVTVNKDKANLKGLTLKDKFTYDNRLIDVKDIQDFNVTPDPGITKENFFNGGFTFTEDFKDTIVITYKYTPPANESNSDKQLNNRADIGTNAWADGNATIGKIGYLKKNYDTGTVEADGKYLDIPYTITLKMPSGGSIQNGATLTDTLQYDAQNSPQTLLTEVTVNGINSSDYTITYYDKDGKVVDSFQEDTITKFVVTFNREITFEKAMDLTFTYTVKGGIDYESGNREFRNTAMFKSGSIDQSVTKTYLYIKNKFLLKKVSKHNGGYNTNIGTVKESDLTDDKLYYEIEVKPKEAGLTDTFEITDELPEGTSFVEGSYDVKADGYRDVTNYVKMTQNGNTLTFTVEKEAFNDGKANVNTLYIHYALKVSRSDPSGAESETREFTNTVKSNGSEASVTVPVFFEEKVIKDEDVLEKTGSQKNDTDITYTVVVNKNKLDLIPNNDSITLTDILNCGIDESKIQDITLVGNKVYVYEYDATQKDGKGALVSNNFYTYTYDSKTHKIQLVLSDSKAYVVEYTYRFKFTSDFAGSKVTIKNDVALAGSYKKEISTEWKKQSAGGSVKKHNSLLIYKVEKGNEDVKLSGAKFDLYRYEYGEFVLVQSDIEVSDIGRKFVSDETDPTTMAATDIAVSENTLYRLTETKAPDGYQIDSDSEHFYFVVGKYGMSMAKLKEAVKESVEGANISSSDVHFASTNAIANITNQIAEGAVRIQKVWQNSDGSEMQASQSEISVNLYQTTRQYQDTDPEVTIEVVYQNYDSKQGTVVASETHHYKAGTNLSVTEYLNEGWTNWKSWNWPSPDSVGMNAKVYLNGSDTATNVPIITNGAYRATYTTTVNSSLKKIRLVVQANTHYNICNSSRPSKITGTQASMLNGDATLVKSVTLSRANNWTAIVEELPLKDDNGNDFYYYVDEKDVPYGYSVSYTNNGVLAGVAGNPITVVNKADEEVKTASFAIHKVDATTKNSLSDAIFALYRAKQNEQGQWVTVGSAVATLESNTNGICGPFSGLIPGEYLLYETSAPYGYATPSDPWRITVNNDCTIDAYGLAEDDGAYVIENSKHPGMISITKKVVGEEKEIGLVYYLKVTLTGSSGKPLTGTYGGQTLDENGSAIYEVRKDGTVLLSGIPVGTKYTVEEVDFAGKPLTGNEGYTSSISNPSGTIATGSTTATVTVTNTYAKAEATAKIYVGKLIKISDGSEFNRKEEFEFTLTGKDNAPMPTSTTVKVKAGDVGSFGEIKYEEAGTYTYTVRETAGTTVGMVYDTTEQEITVRVSEDEPGKLEAVVIYPNEGANAAFVTNKFGLVTVSGTKTWRAPKGTTLPESITVNLYQDGTKIDSKTVTAADNWTYKFANLPKYDADGKEYTYTIDEEPVAGYNKEINGYNLTNTRSEKIEISGEKTWNVPEGTTLPESITVNLYQDGTKIASKTVTKDDNWAYKFEGLPAFTENADKAYVYTVGEEPVEGYITTINGYNITNTITGTTSVSGEKTWKVPEGTTHPDSITVLLKRNGETIDSKTVTADDNWSYSWEKLPKYSQDGKIEYTYTVDEKEVDGYIKKVTGYDITNTITGTTSVEGTKIWKAPDGIELPESITVILYQNGEEYDTKVVTADDNWTYSWEKLPKYSENGETEYTYTVDEREVAGYTKKVEGYDLINTITGITSVEGTKTWRVPEGTTLPESITVNLYQDGIQIDSKTVTAADNWTYKFANLPKYDADGKEYTYTIDEEPVAGYNKEINGYNLTNTRSEKIEISGEKTWNVPEGTTLPESITVNLYQDGTKIDSKTVTAADNWTYKFEGLPAFTENADKAYVYTVEEEPVEGYITTINGYNITNTITGTTSVSGEKTWKVPEGTTLPESITVFLKRNGETIDSKTVTAKDNWRYSWENLPKYSENGKTAYTYTVDEEEVDGYIKKVTGYDITNTITGTTSVEGTKIWKAPAGTKLPESITVILYQNGEEYDTKVVTADDNWTYSWEKLPKYSENGETEYTYTVDEKEVAGYTKKVDGYDLINTITGTLSVSGEKTWNVPEGIELPESITVILNRDGIKIDSKTVTAKDNWTYKFANLPKYDADGMYYDYTIDEEPVAGYNKEINGYNLTNTKSEMIEVSGEKIWKVPEGTTLPESITVILNQNGTEYARTTVTAADNWTYKFENLPGYSEDGKTAYLYTVEEVPVEGYVTTVSGYNIINTLTGTTSVSGEKTWNVPEGTTLPESITVLLKRNGEIVDSKTVTAEDNWAYAWEELPVYSEDGKTEYVYTVDEEEVAGYTKRVDGYNLINTLTGTTSVSGEKTWNVPEGTTLPESITVILKQNGTEYARTTVTAADNWIYKFENLPTYSKDGKTAYTYTVEEVPVEGYITTIDGFDITNTITSVKISKVDIADGKELEGAHIQIIDKETGEVIEEWDSTKEAHEVTGLVPGKTYILRETVAPDGYDITSDTTFVLKEDGTVDTDRTTTTVKDGVLLVEDSRQIQVNFVVNKVSATDDHELFDTILSVYEVTENGEVLVDSWTSRWKEVHNFGSKLSCGKTYILREDKATGGYHKIPDDIRFTVTADGKIQITQGQDWIYENGKSVIEKVTDESGNEIYLIRDVRNPAEEEETEPDGPTDPHQSRTTAPDETTSTPEEETSTTPEETTPEESTTRTPDEEESTPEFTNPAINTTTTADETTVSETPVNETPASSRSVILGIEDMSRTLGMALVGFGAIMLAALIWLYLRSKKA